MIDGVGLQVLLSHYREAVEWKERADIRLREATIELSKYGDGVDQIRKELIGCLEQLDVLRSMHGTERPEK